MGRASNYTEVLLKRNGKFRRLFWIRESQNKNGIRFGFIDRETKGGHMTFYDDGNCHIESTAGVLAEYPYIIDSNRDDSYYILGDSSIPLDKGDFVVNTDTKRETKVIQLDRQELGDCLGVHLYLARKDREAEATDAIISGGFHKRNELVYEEVTELEYMKDFSLITLISREF